MAENIKQKQLVAIDLFCGAGGLTVGLKKAGFRVVAAVEFDPELAKTYKKNHPEVIVIVRDIRKVTGKEILKLTGLKKIDLVAGCPPCQGFSKLTDKHHRDDERNQLVSEMTRLVSELKPSVCMLENVPGLSKRGMPLLGALEKKLGDMKYKVNRGVLQMADYGVPQSRRRLVLLAGKGFEIPLPKPTHARVPEKGSGLKPWVKLRDVLTIEKEPMPFSKAKEQGGARKFHWHVIRDLQPITLRRLRATRAGASRAELPESLRPDCHKGLNKGFQNAYGRMSWDTVAPTMTTGCTTLSSGRFGHPEEDRTISVREAALIQTFPSSYALDTENIETACRLIGNALPCTFAAAVSRQCAERLSAFQDR
ncbi:MAG: DNA cytosine methyltransferase [Candidatus Moraniibacteriota bacterium]